MGGTTQPHGAHNAPGELDQALEDIELRMRALTAERALLLAEAKATGAHHDAGHKTIAGYVRGICSTSTTSAKKDQTLAGLVAEHPAVAEALRQGFISVDHAHEIARFHTNPRIRHLLEAVLDTLLETAEHTSWGQFKQHIGSLIALLDQDGAFREQKKNHANRSAWIDDLGNTLHLSASGGDPITAAQILAVYETFVAAELKADLEARKAEFGDDAGHHPLARTQPQRNYDALVAVFAAAGGSPEAAKLPEPTVNVVIDEHTLHDAFTHAGLTLPNGNQIDIDANGNTNTAELMTDFVDQLADDPDSMTNRMCVLDTGAPIHPTVALQALMTGHIRRVVIDSKSVITDFGTKQRVFTGSAKIAALLLPSECQHPGCTIRSRHSQVDHGNSSALAGLGSSSSCSLALTTPPTRGLLPNANPRCGPHNRYKHRKKLRTRRDERGRTYDIRPDNTIVLAAGERPPDLTTHELEEAARKRLQALIDS